MANEQYKWLNHDVAERLLRGEPLEAVDADARAHADRLAGALAALTVEVVPAAPPSPWDAQLPGEEAALAAFRSARTVRPGVAANGEAAHAAVQQHGGAVVGHHGRTSGPAPVTDAGLVHLGRSAAEARRARWGRPARLGLAAALAAGMFGGVAVAAGTGVLSAFRDDEPEASVSVPAAETPDRPLLSPTPPGTDEEGDDGEAGAEIEPMPRPSRGAPKGDNGAGPDSGGDTEEEWSANTDEDEGRSQDWWNRVLSSCRDVRAGKDLGSDRRRDLENAAGGKGNGRLRKYCDTMLTGGAVDPGKPNPSGTGNGSDKGDGGGEGYGDSGSGGDTKTRSGLDPDEDDSDPAGNGKRHGTGKGNRGNDHRNSAAH